MTDDSAGGCGCPNEYHDVICPLGLRGSRTLESRTNEARCPKTALHPSVVGESLACTLPRDHFGFCSWNRPDKALTDYSWIKVRRYADDPAASWEDRYRTLEKHHEAETRFLIAEVEKHRAAKAMVEVDPRVADLVSAATALREEVRLSGALERWSTHDAAKRFWKALDALPILESRSETPEPRVTQHDWKVIAEALMAAQETGENLASIRARFGLDAPREKSADTKGEP